MRISIPMRQTLGKLADDDRLHEMLIGTMSDSDLADLLRTKSKCLDDIRLYGLAALLRIAARRLDQDGKACS